MCTGLAEIQYIHVQFRFTHYVVLKLCM